MLCSSPQLDFFHISCAKNPRMKRISPCSPGRRPEDGPLKKIQAKSEDSQKHTKTKHHHYNHFFYINNRSSIQKTSIYALALPRRWIFCASFVKKFHKRKEIQPLPREDNRGYGPSKKSMPNMKILI